MSQLCQFGSFQEWLGPGNVAIVPIWVYSGTARSRQCRNCANLGLFRDGWVQAMSQLCQFGSCQVRLGPGNVAIVPIWVFSGTAGSRKCRKCSNLGLGPFRVRALVPRTKSLVPRTKTFKPSLFQPLFSIVKNRFRGLSQAKQCRVTSTFEVNF